MVCLKAAAGLFWPLLMVVILSFGVVLYGEYAVVSESHLLSLSVMPITSSKQPHSNLQPTWHTTMIPL
jgi:hypothetical protein